MNEILPFNGTSDASFDSVFRRSLVMLHKARLEKDVETLFSDGDAAENGYFVRDPTLKDLLLSPPASRICLSMLLSWMKGNDNDQCRRKIDSCAEGGDGGLTRKTIRKACNLAYTEEEDDYDESCPTTHTSLKRRNSTASEWRTPPVHTAGCAAGPGAVALATSRCG